MGKAASRATLMNSLLSCGVQKTIEEIHKNRSFSIPDEIFGTKREIL